MAVFLEHRLKMGARVFIPAGKDFPVHLGDPKRRIAQALAGRVLAERHQNIMDRLHDCLALETLGLRGFDIGRDRVHGSPVGRFCRGLCRPCDHQGSSPDFVRSASGRLWSRAVSTQAITISAPPTISRMPPTQNSENIGGCMSETGK
eukprot:TRINITY_DN59216_c0_g1_i1.p1 TRINITY_DN59216_c0_g1~~TRINITY_DN59216_c0_g1_i1.p1  ORF type:complete len:173 (-),score=14.81 TRINITY_DN59216_c0_g1_i1:91-534(-)